MSSAASNRQIASSAMWAGISSAGNQVLSLIVFVILARLLSPGEFGLVALAMLLIDLTLILSTAGPYEAVVQRPELDETAADTAFWTNAGLGLGFTCLALLLAAPAAALFATPALERIVQMLSVTFLITGLGSVHTARLTREFGFRMLAIRNLLASLLSGVVGIGVALAGGGADALVAQRLGAALCIAAISWWSFRWIPRLRFSPQVFRQLMHYGTRTTGAQMLQQANARLQELIAGLLLGPLAVGILRIAARVMDTLTQLALTPFQLTALPVLARVQGDRAATRDAYRGLSRLSAFIIFPAFAGAWSVAPLLVTFVFGPQWGEAGPLMRVICFAAVALQFNMLLPAALSASGHPGDVLVWSVFQLLLGAAMLTIGAQYGILALMACAIARSYLAIPLGLYLLRRRTGIDVLLAFGSVARPLLAALAMAALVELSVRLLTPVLPIWAMLGAAVLIGLVSYLALSLVFNREMMLDAASLLPRPVRARLLRA